MARRFSYFKETVLRVEENKKSDLPYRSARAIGLTDVFGSVSSA
jgi:hypothetical protein